VQLLVHVGEENKEVRDRIEQQNKNEENTATVENSPSFKLSVLFPLRRSSHIYVKSVALSSILTLATQATS